MIPLLAQVDQANATSWIALLAFGIVVNLVIGLGTLVKMLSGKSSERQIEPTQIAAIQTELKSQTATLNRIDREVGSVQTTATAIEKQMDGMHHRVGAISRDVAGIAARVEGLEKREGNRRA